MSLYEVQCQVLEAYSIKFYICYIIYRITEIIANDRAVNIKYYNSTYEAIKKIQNKKSLQLKPISRNYPDCAGMRVNGWLFTER